MQLLLSTSKGASWIRILENIILVVDAGKVEKATGGLWRATVCRCISLLLAEDCRMSFHPLFDAIMLT